MQAAVPKIVATSIPLLTSFRFAHEPILVGRGDRAFVGRSNELDVLAERLLFSNGGSFLITGYRGVGKTSFVNRVIDRMRELLSWASRDLGDVTLIPVQLTLARAVKPVELMYLVIRRLYEELTDCGLLRELPHELQDDIHLASQRTSMTMTRKLAESLEKNYGVSEGSIGGKLLNSIAKFIFTRKETRSRGDEFVFLTYDEKSAEHDLLRIARRLSRGYVVQEGRLQRLWQLITRQPRAVRKLKFIFVFDEIDKLEDTDNAASGASQTSSYLDEMLASLKNMLTTSGISFLFIAGKDLHDRWLLDLGRGDSVYESVFCYDKYLSCMWEDVADIATGFVERDELGAVQSFVLADFEEFLRYKGRGIPRRTIRTFNEYVRWINERPFLQFTKGDARRFRFYSDLQRLLTGKDQSLFGSLSDEASTQRDRQRLGAYYFIDWILAHGTQPFTIEEGVAASRELSRKIAPAKEVAPDVIRHIIELLIADEILERVHTLPAQTVIVDPLRQSAARYRLTRRRLAELGHFVEDPEVRVFPAAADQAPDGLRIIELIAQGGMGSVFRAWDEQQGRVVAVKTVDVARIGHDSDLLARIRSEAQILRSLRHRNVVRFLRVIDEKTRVYIVMEYIDGTTLSNILEGQRPLPVSLACWIGTIMASAVEYIHSRNIVRLDLKPHNVLIQRDGTIYLSDFGISKSASVEGATRASQTRSGVIIGTPAYMAPEQFEGDVTAASDIYSLGVVLFEMLTHHSPYRQERMPADFMEFAHVINSGEKAHVSDFVEVPESIDAIIDSCLRRNPEERPSLAAIREVLGQFAVDVGPRDLVTFMNAAQDMQRPASQEDRSTADAPSVGLARSAGSLQVAAASGRAASDVATFAIKERVEQDIRHDTSVLLVVLRPPSLEGRTFAILPGKTRIGRSSESDISLDDESVSRFHADIEFIDGTLFLTDLNSANGLFVGNERIRQRTAVRAGSLIRVGSVELSLELSPNAAANAATVALATL